MNIASIIAGIKAFFSSKTGKEVIAVTDQVALLIAPAFEAEIKTIIGTLPPVFTSLETAALEFVNLYKTTRGVTISKSIAIATVQSVYNKHKDEVVAEASKLIAKL